MTALTTILNLAPNLAATLLTQTAGAGSGVPQMPAPAPAPAHSGGLGGGVWFPEQASTIAPTVDLIFNIITWISVVFFVLIVVVMTWFAIRYHTGRAPKATSDVTHNTPLELTWTIIPLILVIAIFYVGLQGYLNLRVPPVGAYDIRVTAQKWSWSFEHSNGASEAGVLAVPVNRPVRLLMQSADVLHACFIPAFRVKQDIVPGRISHIWFEATKTGEFDLYCAEYCGKDHSLMRAKVLVLEEEAFRRHIADVANEADRLTDSELAQYAMAKLYPRCASCHSLDGKSGTGPSWRETNGLWGKERVFSDGSRELVDENYVRDSVLNPGVHVVANFNNGMPTFKGQLNDRQIFALILAIKNLQDFDNAGKLKSGEELDWQAPADFPGSSPGGAPKAAPPAAEGTAGGAAGAGAGGVAGVGARGAASPTRE